RCAALETALGGVASPIRHCNAAALRIRRTCDHQASGDAEHETLCAHVCMVARASRTTPQSRRRRWRLLGCSLLRRRADEMLQPATRRAVLDEHRQTALARLVALGAYDPVERGPTVRRRLRLEERRRLLVLAQARALRRRKLGLG